MKLYEIDEKILNCIDQETGEILDTEKLEQLQIDRNDKIENLILWIKDLKAEEKALKEEKDNLDKRAKAAGNRAESIKNYLKYLLNGEKFKTSKCEVRYTTSTKTIIDDIYKIPEDYLVYLEPKANVTEIKKEIKAGKEIPGVHLEENQNMIIK